MASNRSDHTFWKVKEDEVVVGDIVFLPTDEEIFKDLTDVPPNEVKGHPVLILQLFGNRKVGSTPTWLLHVRYLSRHCYFTDSVKDLKYHIQAF